MRDPVSNKVGNGDRHLSSLLIATHSLWHTYPPSPTTQTCTVMYICTVKAEKDNNKHSHTYYSKTRYCTQSLFFKVLSGNAVFMGWSERGFWRQGSDELGFHRFSFSRINLDAFCAFDDPCGIHRRVTDNPLALQYPLIPPSYLKVLEKNISPMTCPHLVSSLVKAITSVSSTTSSSSSVFSSISRVD